MKTQTILIILNIACLLGSLIWLMVSPSWEPLITSLGLVGALIAQIRSKDNGKSKINMKQKGGDRSKNYQSGRDININK